MKIQKKKICLGLFSTGFKHRHFCFLTRTHTRAHTHAHQPDTHIADFLSKLLTSPEKRMNAEQCLAHAFLSQKKVCCTTHTHTHTHMHVIEEKQMQPMTNYAHVITPISSHPTHPPHPPPPTQASAADYSAWLSSFLD